MSWYCASTVVRSCPLCDTIIFGRILCKEREMRYRGMFSTVRWLVVVMVSVIALMMTSVIASPRAYASDPRRSGLSSLAPPMGWNSFYAYGPNVTQQEVEANASALRSTGLASLGYQRVTVDGGWAAETRTANGNMQPNPVTFPSGMVTLGNYIHSLGLQFGLHHAVGVTDCSGLRPGTQSAPGGAQQDANTFASWGVNYLKYDLCRFKYPAGTTPGAPDYSSVSIVSGREVLHTYDASSPSNSLSGDARVADCPDCANGKKVTAIGFAGGALTFRHVIAPRNGIYTLKITYVNVARSPADLGSRFALLSVNGRKPFATYYPVPVAPMPNGKLAPTDVGKTATLTTTVRLHRGANSVTFSDPNSKGDVIMRAYEAMATALAKTGHTISLGVCEYGLNRPWLWAPAFAENWRTTVDVSGYWQSVPAGYARGAGTEDLGAIGIVQAIDEDAGLGQYAGPGHWNKPISQMPMQSPYLSLSEKQAMFSMLSMLASPLIIGANINALSPAELSILSNRSVIAVDQDPLGVQAHRFAIQGNLQVWARPLADGSWAIAFLNVGSTPVSAALSLKHLGFRGRRLRGASSYGVKNLWTNQAYSTRGNVEATVAPQSATMLRVTPYNA